MKSQMKSNQRVLKPAVVAFVTLLALVVVMSVVGAVAFQGNAAATTTKASTGCTKSCRCPKSPQGTCVCSGRATGCDCDDEPKDDEDGPQVIKDGFDQTEMITYQQDGKTVRMVQISRKQWKLTTLYRNDGKTIWTVTTSFPANGTKEIDYFGKDGTRRLHRVYHQDVILVSGSEKITKDSMEVTVYEPGEPNGKRYRQVWLYQYEPGPFTQEKLRPRSYFLQYAEEIAGEQTTRYVPIRDSYGKITELRKETLKVDSTVEKTETLKYPDDVSAGVDAMLTELDPKDDPSVPTEDDLRQDGR